MIKEMLMMASYGFYGGEIGEFLSELEMMGVFSYLLPFLLIFALVFGLLSQTKLFKENKSINPIIAAVVALLALQFDLVSVFFAEIFPRLGVGLGIVLVMLILLGIFMPKKNWAVYALFGAVAIIFAFILIDVGSIFGWSPGNWFYDNLKTFLILIGIGAILAIIIASTKPDDEFHMTKFFKDMLGDGK